MVPTLQILIEIVFELDIAATTMQLADKAQGIGLQYIGLMLLLRIFA